MTGRLFDVSAFAYAHRGLWGGAVPENSLTAFQAAAKAGVGAELDVRVTQDDRLVVFHDTTLERMCGRPERVDQLPFRTIRTMQLPDGSPIPTLEEALEAMAGTPTLIEIKVDQLPDSTHRNRNAIGPVIELLRASNVMAAVMSFDEPTVWQLAAAAEGVGGSPLAQPVGQLIEPFDVDAIKDKAARARETGCDYIAPHFTSLAIVEEASGGLPLATWTIREPAALELARKYSAAPIFEGFSPSLASGLAKPAGTPI